MTTSPTPPPRSLKNRGRQLWISIHAEFEPHEHETALILEVCRTLDTIDALAKSIETDGVMITGSQGQLVLNTAVAELRQQQAAYARLLPLLNLDSSASVVGILSPTQARASHAATAKWAPVKELKARA
ncbi:terminase [Cryobacterium arcticum]|uniref:Terminase n=1 Tax=Cryobacterium arcticum TaxID=670052 RepID=A0A318A0U1_9MICO|nr:terminase [Cryobacterium arcticum]PXA71866.1 terminase [Cryobacterium arcticum]